MKMLEPVGEVKRSLAEAIPLSFLDGLKGKKIAFVSNEWRFLSNVWEEMEDLLRQKGVAETFEVHVPVPRAAPRETIEGVINRADAAIVGIGN